MSLNNIASLAKHDVGITKQRPLSSSFNELSRGNSVSRKDHELHYFKSYTSLTECELIILRKTAFTNLRNQFRAINEHQRATGSTNALNSSSNNNSSSGLPIDKTNESVNTPSAFGSHLLLNQNSATGSFSALNHHSHNTVPGKDLRESVIKTLENINRGRNSKKWKLFTKKDKKKEVFGVPLVSSLEYAFVYIDPTENCNNKKIPIVVYECINFLRKNGLSKEGIFRVNGSERRINNSLKIFNEPAGYGFGFDFDGMNVFDAASLLKLYLRQLPEPLIPYCLYSSFLDVIKFIPDTYEKVQAFQYLFMMLPSAHLILLEILLQFLSEIIQHFNENHMNAHNLACIFAPNLLRSKESASSSNLLNVSSSEEYEAALQVIEFLINHKNKFCITSPDVKPFQLFNKFERDGIPTGNLEGINSLSVSDFSAFQRNSALFKIAAGSNRNNNNNNSTEKDKKSQLKNEIKADSETNVSSSKINQDENSGSINSLQPHNPVSVSTSNMKSNNTTNDIHESSKSLNKIKSDDDNEVENDADINLKTHRPVVDPINVNSSNSASPASSYNSPVALTLKCKSNLENVRNHSENSFYQINICPLVSTSLNRINYPPIKNEEFYEYLARDNDNITPAIASEKIASPCVNTHIEKIKENCTSSLAKESISVASFNKSISLDDIESKDVPVVKKADLQNNKNGDQPYPSNVMNLAQKNRENGISFLSPLSTPTQPIFCIPPPPTTPPIV